MVHIYCGDGKGKTTAAMGLALRMAGAGKQVLIGQFFKNGSSGEIKILKTVPGVTAIHCQTVPGRYVHMTDTEKDQARRDYTAYLLELLERGKSADLLVLDEPVTGLDPAAADDLYRTLRYLNRTEGMAVVMVTHDIRSALRDAAAILHAGRDQWFLGTPGEYLASPYGKRFGGDLS